MLIFALLAGCAHQPPPAPVQAELPAQIGSVTLQVQTNGDNSFSYQWVTDGATHNPSVTAQPEPTASGALDYQWFYDGIKTKGAAAH
jgi:hypothetical protein